MAIKDGATVEDIAGPTPDPPGPHPRGAHGGRRHQRKLRKPRLQGGMDIPVFITSILKKQAESQLAQLNANHANLLAFQTAMAQALAAKSRNKESKLTGAKMCILQACTGTPHADKFQVEQVYWDLDVEGGSSDALGRIL